MQSSFRLSLTCFVVSAATMSLLIINPIVPYGANRNKAYGQLPTPGFNVSCTGSSSFMAGSGNSNTGNTICGSAAFLVNSTGNSNTAIGLDTLFNNTTGSSNTAIGHQAGFNLTTGHDNIDIANQGLAGESSTIRIGSDDDQKQIFIAGITGVNMTSGSAVYINSSGQLGTILSSRSFKTDIHQLGDLSQKLLTLRPVSFRYKQADDKGAHPLQYGLIAEEVAEVFPELVQYDKEGKPLTVYYHELTPLLLAEVQKEHQKVIAQQAELTSIEQKNLQQQSEIAQQQSEIASLKQQLVSQKRQQATRIASVELKLNQLDHLIQANNTSIRMSKTQ